MEEMETKMETVTEIRVEATAEIKVETVVEIKAGTVAEMVITNRQEQNHQKQQMQHQSVYG